MRTNFKHHLFRKIKLVLLMLLLALLFGTADFRLDSGTIALAQSPNVSNWSTATQISPSDPDVGYVGYTEAVSDSTGRLHVFWDGRTEEVTSDSRIFYRFFDNDGQWSETVDILIDSRFPAVRMDSEGTLHLFGSGDCLFHTYNSPHSANSALDWMQNQRCIAPPQVSQFDVIIDDGDQFHLAYTERDGSTVQYMRSDAFGVSWTPPSAVATEVNPDRLFTETAIAQDNNGRLHIAWTLYPHEGFPPLGIQYAFSDDGEVWEGPQYLSEDYNLQPQLLANGDELHLIWNGALKRSERYHRSSLNGGDTWSDIASWVSVPSGILGHPDGVVDSTGVVHAVAATDTGAWYATHSSGTWLPARQIFDENLQTNSPSVALVLGNRLHAVFLQGGKTVWHTSRLLEIPGSEPISIAPPVVEMTSAMTSSAESAEQPVITVTTDEASVTDLNLSNAPQPRASYPMWLFWFIPMVFVGLVVLIRTRRQ